MSITTRYDFINPANFTFDPTKIDFTGILAKLKLQNLTEDFTQDFASSVGFTFASTKTEFVGGLCRQKDQRPSDATFGAAYTLDINGSWGNGVLTGTGSSATVSGGKLNLKGGTAKYVTYDAAGNSPNTQVGCIKLKYTPNYSGTPSANRYLFDLYSNPANDNNSLQVYHGATGNIHARLCNSTGAYIFSSFLAAWVPVAGIEYEFEFDFDFTSGATRLFIDGIQIGSTITNTGIRTAPSYLRIGAAHDISNSDGEFNDVEVFTTVQHTANYTSGYSISETIYGSDVVTVPEMGYIGAGTLQQLTSITTTESNAPRYTLQIGRSGNYLYWDGSAWVTSNNTYAQANTKADFVAHCTTINITGNVYGQFRIYFTDSNSLQQSIDVLTASVVGQQYELGNPTIRPNGSIEMDSFISFLLTYSAIGSDAVKLTLEIDGIEKYWSGTAWVTSIGFAQSNTPAEIVANCLSLDIHFGVLLKPIVYLHSSSGITSPTITSMELGYSFFAHPVDAIHICTVWGYIYNESGVPLIDISIHAQLLEITKYKTVTAIGNKEVVTTTNIDGYWEMDLVECDNMLPKSKYRFTFSGTGYTLAEDKLIPDETSKNYFLLL
jgi:hypothetical protein